MPIKGLIGDSALQDFGPRFVMAEGRPITAEEWTARSNHWAHWMVNDVVAREGGNVYRHPDVVIEFRQAR